MSDFTDWTQEEMARRVSAATIAATGSLLVKADNAFSRDYDNITFDNFEASLTHDNLISGTIAAHDTSATGTQLDTLTDNSIANTLHRHSELVASDGDPDPALSVAADGDVYIVNKLGVGVVNPGSAIEAAGLISTKSATGGLHMQARDGLGAGFQWYNPDGSYVALNQSTDLLKIDNNSNVIITQAAGKVAFANDATNFYIHQVDVVYGLKFNGYYGISLFGRENLGLHVAEDGNVGLSVTDPDTKLEIFKNTIQLKLSYDGSNYTTFLCGATGDLSITPSGTTVTHVTPTTIIQNTGQAVLRLSDTTASEYTDLIQTASDGDFQITRVGTGGVDFSIKNDGITVIGQRGNVGINTSIPAATLTVKNNGNDTAPLGGEKVVNGDFASDLSDWTSTGWTWDTGTAKHTTGNTNPIYQGIAVTDTEMYHIEFTLSARTAGTITLTLGGLPGSFTTTTNATHTYSFKADATTTLNLVFLPTTDFDGKLDDITLKQITDVSDAVILLEDSNAADKVEIRTALDNTLFGQAAGQYITSGEYNVGLGYQALYSNTTGSSNIAIGSLAFYTNMTGYHNIAIGYAALYNSNVASINVAIGNYSLYTNLTGTDNTAIGYQALYYNAVGDRNTAIGTQALFTNVGNYNTAIGYQALYTTTANFNTAIGNSSLLAATIGSGNVAIGYNTLVDVTEGVNNIAIGYTTGGGITTGDYNTIIGANVTGLAAGLSNNIIIADGEGTIRIIVDDTGDCKIGTAANYSKFEADGTLEFNGTATVWDDIRVSALSTKLPASGAPNFTQLADDGAASIGVFTYFFADNAEESVFFNIQMPHGYKFGSTLHPHVHWAPQTTDTGQVDWFLEYTIANIDGTFGNTATVKMSDIGDGTINKHQLAETEDISGAGLTLSHMLLCRLYRDGGVGDDDFSGNAAFLEFDIHFEMDTIGSRQEATK